MEQTPNTVVTFDVKLLRNFLKFFLLLVAAYILVQAFPHISSVITLLLISLLLSTILSPFVTYMERQNIPRAIGALIVLLGFLLVFMIAVRFLIPVVREQAMAIHDLVQSQQPAEILETARQWLSDRFPFLQTGDLQNLDIGNEINAFIGDFVSGSVSLLVNVAGMISTFFIVLVITYLLLKDSRKLNKGLINLIPNKYFEPGLRLYYEIQQSLSNYIRGQLTDALIIGILSIIGLWILQIKYFVFIGLIAGLANLIPYIGPVAGAIPAMAISIINNPGEPITLLYIAIMFAVVQMIDNSVVSPMVMSRSVNIHPITVIVIIIIGGNLMGVFGMLIAVPVAGIAKVTIQQIFWTIKHYRVV